MARIILHIVLLLLVVLFAFACGEEDAPGMPPSVQTTEVYAITTVNAFAKGIVSDIGSASVTDRGFCWGTTPNPTIASPHKMNAGEGSGSFQGELANLAPNTNYYVRAYATNRFGTSYGENEGFTTSSSHIVYHADGSTLQYGDAIPLAVDLNADGQVDFSVFVEATASSQESRLYFGINPIGNHLIKSGPANAENFLNMGLLISEVPGQVIDEQLEADQRWTGDWGALVIKNETVNGGITYEGDWLDTPQMVAIQLYFDGQPHFGWMRLEFNKQSEILTLVDYAYLSLPNQSIVAGSGTP